MFLAILISRIPYPKDKMKPHCQSATVCRSVHPSANKQSLCKNLVNMKVTFLKLNLLYRMLSY